MSLCPSTPFTKAIAIRDVRSAIRMARKDPSIHGLWLQCPSTGGQERAMHAAVRLHSRGLVKALLEGGMDIDTLDSRGFSSLALAPECYSKLDMIQLLVESGADIHFRNDFTLWSAIWQASYEYEKHDTTCHGAQIWNDKRCSSAP